MSSVAAWPNTVLRHGEVLLERRPELPALAAAAGAWVILLAMSPPAFLPWHDPVHTVGMQMAGMQMAGMGHGPQAWSMAGAARGAVLWVVMTVAMMLPLTIPGLRYVARMVPRTARPAAVATFSAGYVVVWLPGAILAIWVQGRPPLPKWVLALGFVAAAAYELTPAKRKALLHCHRHRVVRAHQPARRKSCWQFGLWRGGWCLVSCGPVMGALMLGAHTLAPMVAVTVGLYLQQFNPVAHWYRTWSAAALVALAACIPLFA